MACIWKFHIFSADFSTYLAFIFAYFSTYFGLLFSAHPTLNWQNNLMLLSFISRLFFLRWGGKVSLFWKHINVSDFQNAGVLATETCGSPRCLRALGTVHPSLSVPRLLLIVIAHPRPERQVPRGAQVRALLPPAARISMTSFFVAGKDKARNHSSDPHVSKQAAHQPLGTMHGHTVPCCF